MFSRGQTISTHQNLQINLTKILYISLATLSSSGKRQMWSFQIWLFCEKMFCISTYLTLHKHSVQIQLSERMIYFYRNTQGCLNQNENAHMSIIEAQPHVKHRLFSVHM